jgi:hypothetical protein
MVPPQDSVASLIPSKSHFGFHKQCLWRADHPPVICITQVYYSHTMNKKKPEQQLKAAHVVCIYHYKLWGFAAKVLFNFFSCSSRFLYPCGVICEWLIFSSSAMDSMLTKQIIHNRQKKMSASQLHNHKK